MATPKLALIPTGYKAGKLYSVLPQSGVGDFTFARASEATRVNEDGLIETMGNNIPRLDYTDGGCPNFLLEPQRTNVIPYSEDFSNSGWTKNNTTVTSGFTSPDGTNNAYKLVEDTSNSIHRMYQTATVSASPNATISIYVKYYGRKFVLMRIADSTVGRWYDIENGVLGGIYQGTPNDSSIESVGNGWYRITISHTVSNQARLELWVSDTESTSAYQGNGTSGVYIYGAQLEAGSYSTSLIKTNGSTVTRVAETCNGSGDASTFNDSEGVLMAEIANSETNNGSYLGICNGGTNERLIIGNEGGFLRVYTDVNVDGSVQSANKDFNKIAVKYNSSNTSIYYNGFLIRSINQSPNLSGINQLKFTSGGTTQNLYGKTKQIQYYDSALTDSELETLTSWVSFQDMANGQNYTII